MNIIDSNHLELRGKSEIAKHFKGHVQLDLCDPLTGKVKERVEGENTFTNALDSAINNCPYGLDNGVLGGVPSLNGNNQNILPLQSIGLGGVLLFPQFTNPDNMDDLYEPLSNAPTAYGSVLNPNATDSKLGVFNNVESGTLTEGDKIVGYRFIYDWLTSTGNGSIGAIALSHGYCNYMFNNHAYYNTAGEGNGYSRTISTEHAVHRVNSTHWVTMNPRTNIITVYAMTYNDLPLMIDYASILPNKIFEITPDNAVSTALDDKYLYTIQTNGGTSASIVIKKYDLTNGELVSTDTLSVSVPTALVSTYPDGIADTYIQISEFYDIKDGYLYGMCGYHSGLPTTRYVTAIAKIQLSNPANITNIPLNPTIGGYRSNLFIGHDDNNIYIRASGRGLVVVIGDDDIPIKSSGNDANNMLVLGQSGVWRILARDSTPTVIGAAIFAPYLATKYTLDSPVTKTADKTMKLTYSVIQV